MPDDMHARVSVLESKVLTMEGNLERMSRFQEQMAADVHAIRETIATGKGAWWAAAGLLTLLMTGGGLAGYLVHSVVSRQ